MIPEYGSSESSLGEAWKWVGDLSAGAAVAAQTTVFHFNAIDANHSFWQGLSNTGNELFKALLGNGAQFGVRILWSI